MAGNKKVDIKIQGRRTFLGSALAAPILFSGRPAFSGENGWRDVAYYSARADIYSTLASTRMILSTIDREEHYPVEDVRDMIFQKPGRMCLPFASTTCTPAGTCTSPRRPIALKRPFSMTMTLFSIGARPVPSINVPP